MEGLTELKRKVRKRERIRTRRDDPLQELSDKLNKEGYEGRVTSVLVFDPVRGEINCYGIRLNDGRIVNRINVSGVRGRGMARSISYPEISRLKSYHRGWFVPAEEFWGKEGDFVAIVNVPWNYQDRNGVIPYRL